MGKLTYCKTCGKEIAKAAKTCPGCGAKNKKGNPILTGVLVILFLAFILGSSEDTSTTKTSGTSAQDSTSTAKNIYSRAVSDFQEGDYLSALEECDRLLTYYADIDVGGDVNQLKTDIENAIPRVSAVALTKAYKENEVNADMLYKDKLLIVTGTVDSIGKDILDETYVKLSDGETYSFYGPQCYFEDNDEINKVATLKKGNKITIQGICEGSAVMSPQLKNCVIK